MEAEESGLPSPHLAPGFPRDVFGDEITFASCGFDLSWAKEQTWQFLIFSKLLRDYHMGTRMWTYLLSSEHTSGLFQIFPKNRLTWVLQGHLCSHQTRKSRLKENKKPRGSVQKGFCLS